MDDTDAPQDDLYEEPMEVKLLGDAVVVLGPDGVAIAMTAEAACQSARRLSAAARRAPKNRGVSAVRTVRVPPLRRS